MIKPLNIKLNEPNIIPMLLLNITTNLLNIKKAELLKVLHYVLQIILNLLNIMSKVLNIMKNVLNITSEVPNII